LASLTTQRFAKTFRFLSLLLAFNLAACSALASATPTATSIPTATSTPAPIATTEQTQCAYTQNPGPAPEAVVNRAQTAFAATGLPGEVLVNGYGEYNSCGGFGLMEVDFQINLVVPSLTDQAAMAALVPQVQDIPQQALQGESSLGNFKIQFKTTDHFCWWDIAAKTCGDILNGS
jgi:hypothetical protein